MRDSLEKYSREELLKACRAYADKTGRRVSFEYTLIKGVNDSNAHAIELAERLLGILCHVNLIPVNAVKERHNVKSSTADIIKFQNVLKSMGINATIRRTLGADINASCGQLRRLKNRGDTNENSCQD